MSTYFYEFKDKNNRNTDKYRHRMALIKGHLVCYDFSNTYKITEPTFNYLGQGIHIYGPHHFKTPIQDSKTERKLAKYISEMLKYNIDNIRIFEILNDCMKSGMITNFRQLSNTNVIKILRKDGRILYVSWANQQTIISEA